jgi:hypothetical protein
MVRLAVLAALICVGCRTAETSDVGRPAVHRPMTAVARNGQAPLDHARVVNTDGASSSAVTNRVATAEFLYSDGTWLSAT